MNTHELAEAAGIKVFDTALPLAWYEDVHEKVGLWPQALGFVWSYDEPARIWGQPIPLTNEAIECLRSYHLATVQGGRGGHSSLDRDTDTFSSADVACQTCGAINAAETQVAEAAR